MSEPVALRPERDEDTIKALREWLEKAERGEIIGVLLFANMRGENAAHRWSGFMPSGVALVAIEWWKRRVFSDEG